MRIQEERNFVRAVEVDRFGDDAVDFGAVFAALPVDNFGGAQRVLRKPSILIRDRLNRSKTQIGAKNLARMIRIGPQTYRRLSVFADAGHVGNAGLVGELVHSASRDVGSKNLSRLA